MSKDTLKKRAKTAAIALVIKDRAELESVASRAAALQLKHDALVIKRDRKLALLKEKYNHEIGEVKKEYKLLVTSMASWCIRNRSEAFGKAKSIEVLGHIMKFVSNGGAVGFAKGHSEETVIEALAGAIDEEFAEQFLRVELALNKEQVGAHWKEDGELLKKFGLTFEETENFIFTPDRSAMASKSESVTVNQEAA